MLARAVLRLTGVHVPPDERDVDKIGNNLELWVRRHYVEEVRKLTNRILRDAAARKQQKDEVGLRCCAVTGWGEVREHHIVEMARQTAAQ